jgi:hypothetical protein
MLIPHNLTYFVKTSCNLDMFLTWISRKKQQKITHHFGGIAIFPMVIFVVSSGKTRFCLSPCEKGVSCRWCASGSHHINTHTCTRVRHPGPGEQRAPRVYYKRNRPGQSDQQQPTERFILYTLNVKMQLCGF